MSRSYEPLDEGEPSEAHLALSQMMKAGRSWSGRERHCAYLNLGTTRDGQLRRFANVSSIAGLDFPEDGRALCLTDWDHDGDLDFWISNRTAPQLRFLRNEDQSGNDFVAFKLVGTSGNRDAVGARLTVHGGREGSPQRKTVRAGEGYLAQSSRWLVFGLGPDAGEASLTINWPGGGEQRIDDLAANRHYLVREGSPVQVWSRPREKITLEPAPVTLPPESLSARIPLVTLLKVPEMEYETFDGTRVPVRSDGGRAVLLNLWASWCRPCLQELEAFTSRADDFEAAGIEVVALALDGVGEDRTDPALTRKTLSKLGLPFRVGRANREILMVLDRLHARLLPMDLDLVVPMSLLIDDEGRLAAIYKGPVSVDQVRIDARHSEKPRPARLIASGGRGGISLESAHATVARAADQHELSQRFQFAQDMWQARKLAAADVQFREVLALVPDFGEAANNLGLVYAEQGRHAEALLAYQRAIQCNSQLGAAYLNAGLSLEALSRPEEARRHYLKALAIDPGLAKANDALGLLYAKEGELEQAARYFLAETAANPQYAEGHNHLGLVFLSLNRPEEAVAPLQRATELVPGHADALNNLGLAYKRLGDVERAGEAFRSAVEAAPRYVPALLNLGVHLLRQGELEAAEQRFLEVLTLQPSSGMAQRNLAKTRRLLGR